MEKSNSQNFKVTNGNANTTPTIAGLLTATPVHNDLLERAVLGVLLGIRAGAYYDCADLIDERAFYGDRHRLIFKAIAAVVDQGGQPTPFSVQSYVDGRPKEFSGADITLDYLLELTMQTLSPDDLRQNCAILSDLRARREAYELIPLLTSIGTTQAGDVGETVTEAVNRLQAVTDLRTAKTKTMKDALADLDGIVSDNLAGHRHTGAPTGFALFDGLGGLMPGNLFIIAADSGMGKTSLALDFAIHAATAGHPVAFYSCEMTAVELAARAVAAMSGTTAKRISQDPLTDEELTGYDHAVTALADLPFYVDEQSTSSINFIISSIRQLARRHHIEAAFIDYLQILQNNGRRRDQTEEQYFGETARRLKNLAKELGVCIVLLSQFSRDRENPAPQLWRLRGSGQIVEAADIVATIYRPEVYAKTYPGEWCQVDPRGTALLAIKKGRNVGQHAAIVGFGGSTTHFYDLDHVPLLPRLTGTTGTTPTGEKKQSSFSSFDDLFNEIS